MKTTHPMIDIARAFTLCLLTIVTLSGCQKSMKKDGPPNVIIILTDDQGYGDVGFNGCTDIPTPNIDRIARDGVVFTNGYVSWSACGPSRAGLITGRYQDRFGFSRNPLFTPKDSLEGLPLSEETLADVLKKADYRTKAIGKWHLGAHRSQRPLKRGFDEFFGFLTGGHRYFPEEWTLNDISEVKAQFDAYKTRLLRDNTRIDEREYLTDALSREAVDFIKQNDRDPFFLYLAYNAPHTPLQATEKYLNRFQHIKNIKRRTYAAMVSSVDDGVGKILDQLESSGIDENTMVFFLSDNGGARTNASSNAPLRDYKGSMYDGGIHVPFAMQWKQRLPKGMKYESPVISLDIFATVIAQADVSTTNQLDGVDLTPYLTGEVSGLPHEYLYWRQYDKEAFAIRKGNLKLVHEKDRTQLFDLTSDRAESNPIENPETLTELKQQHQFWNEQNMKPVFYGLMKDEEYNDDHPLRFEGVEAY